MLLRVPKPSKFGAESWTECPLEKKSDKTSGYHENQITKIPFNIFKFPSVVSVAIFLVSNQIIEISSGVLNFVSDQISYLISSGSGTKFSS